MTERELALLTFVAEAQPISTEHARLVLEVSAPIARRSIRKLRDLGLIAVHVVSLNELNRLTLTEAGRARLVREGEDRSLRVVRSPGRVGLLHHERSVDLHAALLAAARRLPGVELLEFLHERDVRRELGAGAGALVPDAVATLSSNNDKVALAVEIDLGTENPSYFARTKIEQYALLHEGGRPLRGVARWCLVVLTESDRRRNRLASAAWEAGVPAGLYYTAVSSELTDQNVFGPVWWTPRAVGASAGLVLEPLPLGAM